MKKICKALALLLSLYILASAAMTAAYHLAPYPTPELDCSVPWEIATHRNGLMIWDLDECGLWLLNPLNNYGDDWLQVIEWPEPIAVYLANGPLLRK